VSEQLQKLLAELRRRFEVLYGLRLVRLMLFGSQARGDYDSTKEVSVDEAEEQIANAEHFLEVARQRLGILPPRMNEP
jgi:uncharacterized protein (UPF0332 family)